MSTIEGVVETGRRRRRCHSVLFKAESVGACQQPGVSVAAVALARGLNANLLRRWVTAAERGKSPIAIRNTVPDKPAARSEGFVPVVLTTESPVADRPLETIRIEVRRKDRRVIIEWPASAASACAPLLRALVK